MYEEAVSEELKVEALTGESPEQIRNASSEAVKAKYKKGARNSRHAEVV